MQMHLKRGTKHVVMAWVVKKVNTQSLKGMRNIGKEVRLSE